MDDGLVDVLSLLGCCFVLYFVVYKVYPFFQWFYAFFIRQPKDLRKYGDWAIVTGGTDGIGKAYCIEFARAGMNVLLMSRNPAKCQAVEEELRAEFPKVQISHLAIDFGHFDAEKRELVRSTIANLDVGVLVNNVFQGQGHLAAGGFHYLHEANDEHVRGQVETNILSLLWMLRIVLGDEMQGMVSRKRGAIVNIGSMAGLRTFPVSTLYGCAKSYVNMLSRSMKAELASEHGIHVQCVNPLRVVTSMIAGIGDGKESLLWPTPQKFAKSAVRMIGYEAVTCGYWPHEVQKWGVMQAPQGSWDRSMAAQQIAAREGAIAYLKEHAASAEGGGAELQPVAEAPKAV